MGGAEKLCSLVPTVDAMEVAHTHTERERERERMLAFCTYRNFSYIFFLPAYFVITLFFDKIVGRLF